MILDPWASMSGRGVCLTKATLADELDLQRHTRTESGVCGPARRVSVEKWSMDAYADSMTTRRASIASLKVGIAPNGVLRHEPTPGKSKQLETRSMCDIVDEKNRRECCHPVIHRSCGASLAKRKPRRRRTNSPSSGGAAWMSLSIRSDRTCGILPFGA